MNRFSLAARLIQARRKRLRASVNIAAPATKPPITFKNIGPSLPYLIPAHTAL